MSGWRDRWEGVKRRWGQVSAGRTVWSFLVNWRALLKVGLVAVAIIVLFGVGWMVNDWWWQRGEIERLNELAEHDQLRITELEGGLQAAERRLFVAKDEKDVLKRMWRHAAERAAREGYKARQAYDLAVNYRNQLVGVTEAMAQGEDTVLPIDLQDGAMGIAGAVTLHDHHVPRSTMIDVQLEAELRRIAIQLAILEETATGGLVAQVTTDDPHVGVVELDGITDFRTTGAERKRHRLLNPFVAGAAVGAGGTAVAWFLYSLFN